MFSFRNAVSILIDLPGPENNFRRCLFTYLVPFPFPTLPLLPSILQILHTLLTLRSCLTLANILLRCEMIFLPADFLCLLSSALELPPSVVECLISTLVSHWGELLRFLWYYNSSVSVTRHFYCCLLIVILMQGCIQWDCLLRFVPRDLRVSLSSVQCFSFKVVISSSSSSTFAISS